MTFEVKTRTCLVFAATLLASAAQAQTHPTPTLPEIPQAPNASDPLQPFNKAAYSFNKLLVTWVVNPFTNNVAPLIPEPVTTALGNAYNNISEVEYVLNGALMLDPGMITTAVGRMAINTTVGIGGLFDVANRLGLPPETEDYGAALCSTGLPPGAYLVLPVVGSTNAISAPVLIAGLATEWYLLGFISSTLQAADIIVDIGGALASLRYSADVPSGADGYAIQRAGYEKYITSSCRRT